MHGVDECEMIRNLPEGLRRDIKYHLCLDLFRQVPLFQYMDDLVLENICDRVISLIFTKGETVNNKRKRSSSKNAVCGERPPPKQPSPARRPEALLHVRPRQLQRLRAAVVLSPPPFHRAPPTLVLDARNHGGFRARGRGRQVRDTALQVHFCEREGLAERQVLLPRVADLGGGGDPSTG
ncbi:hypothetical protein TIFTF001_038288 [Ficus carica]|uniref:Uncharacterized protein n=1 Tax=Ficus carica TaxID=3494 RepID=A0AA88E719_FICCA|nr:hypothetical protein TIFTF001_038285 [Ficus carica]GMN69237.1 hypothetical protein TIFTF001_038288 [Ficus carica]